MQREANDHSREARQQATALRARLLAGDAGDANYATRFVDELLAAAQTAGASDLHLQPTAAGLHIQWRLDGVLQSLGEFPPGIIASIVARLKVLAELLTYRCETPQEGRIRNASIEMRVSTFPTLHGERVVVRLFGVGQERFERLDDLGFPRRLGDQLRSLIGESSGALLITGPAGSGKTTTAYALLREIHSLSHGGRSAMSLEDPIEGELSGISQSEVNDAAGLSLATGLRSLMRQDPEVILVGEMRDRPTAEVAFQAALTGHLVLSTFHAGSAAGAVSRLADMGFEPYVLKSGILAILAQRLVRRLCHCRRSVANEQEKLGFEVASAHVPVGCEQCRGTGFAGRIVLAELLQPGYSEIGQAILQHREMAALQDCAENEGMVPLAARARAAMERGETSPSEVRRVLGIRGAS
ncbi:MAG: type II/IV secretion system protein [Planctomycetales bacterium]|nr:type II/IV secretion system protein [Planctomycetales bacterium]